MLNLLSNIVFLIIITTCIPFVTGDTDNNPPLRIEPLYQNVQFSMKKPLTLEDLKKDKDLLRTISQYTRDRYNKNYTNPDEALEDFLSEYRGIQNNTFNALTFANYASEIEDPEYKAQLDRLYNMFSNLKSTSKNRTRDYLKWEISNPKYLVGIYSVIIQLSQYFIYALGFYFNILFFNNIIDNPFNNII